jgi:hypothetical protein
MGTRLILLGCLVTLACDNQNARLKVGGPVTADMEEALSIEVVHEQSSQPDADTDNVTARQLVKNGALVFRTDNLEETKVAVEMICKKADAYISNENLSNYDDRISYHQTIRIPAPQFDSLLHKLEQLADDVENKSIQITDVTEEFIDVQSRLKTKYEIEARYRELLKQARTVEDILSVEKELGNVRGDIESSEGRLKYLRNQVAYSTLDLNYYALKGTNFGFASKFIVSLRNGWDNLLGFIIGLLSVWPFLILIVVAIWAIRKYWFRKKPEGPG